MDTNYAWLYTCSFCCLYPVIFHLGIVWITRYAKRIDWSNIKFPWSRDQ